MTDDLQRHITHIETLAREAGAIAMRYYGRDVSELDLEHKEDAGNSPVTIADMAVDTFLREKITQHFPEDGWLSEETADDLSRLEKKRVWIVDPIDGTRSFLEQDGTFAISIALVEDGHPVLGVVYAPACEEMVSAYRGGKVHVNGTPVSLSVPPVLEKALCLTSISETRKGLWQHVEGKMPLKPVHSIAYKLAMIAAGKADVMATLRPKSEWDVAAGHLLCEAAGLKVTDIDGAPITYNHENIIVNKLIAAPEQLYDAFAQLIKP